ncbi:hypothetical protein AFLA_013218 [Aspergillus flavus NRRL3357]|nr:hypothetical protein AFLA_013218 [Aspergillus flavus NRRL3357]
MVTLKRKETELAAGSKLRAVLPQGSKPWYRTWHLVKLNLILMVSLVSSASVGYDGSMMNFCTEILTVIIPLLKIETSVLVSLKAR